MVAGDLPFNGHGDFYLTVECGDNPPMSTSIAENCNPRVVHFNEVLTLRVRDSFLEDAVRFTVKELNIFGSQEIAELRLNPQRVCEWTRDKCPLMRFQMEPCDRSVDMDTPCWIALEFAPCPEFGGRQSFTVHLFDTRTGVFDTTSCKDFKSRYKLLDRTGEKQNEAEDNDEEIHRANKRREEGACCTVCLVFLVIIAAVIFRLFLWKCWKEFTFLAVQQGIPNPTHDEVMAVCDNPPNNVRPMVFEHFAREHNIQSLPCYKGVCHTRDQFVQNRVAFFTFMGILVLIVLCLLARPSAAARKKKANPFKDDDEAPRRTKTGTRTLSAGPGH